ncbi:Flp pilus assembly protein TadG [Cupriavidus necator]|uniref:Pilus assembly protein n=1 Tax=Cupriavidus necator (strain ATCC 17699 / DSM 428 / KCTC 22496 / NCIMB 10442 / H16 / Stanier 337) TaxID=381666 RepID=Q0KCZ1_CUPNH|nr:MULTISPECIES: TadE family protein [Cupriavidus]EON21806.1 flp pilus assembly protein TadG [Cupriavidus sp. GA3-3]KUE89634.1 pilus assembly protein TadG [Cupriavidus necator]QCC00042.1 pilus assembly protein [Cupriavidus necator H16]QQB77144.1 pilus assembly protein [Cupriavidus necator]WKA41895.1 pilus assembly protein [Cupriavidus necator]
MTHQQKHAARRGARGQSAVEFLIIAPALLLLCLGVIQFGLLYQAKATLDHAALQAAREGAVDHGRLASMRKGLALGLTPLFVRSADRTAHATGYAKAQFEARTQARIDVLNPTPAALQDFGRSGYYAGKTTREIPNDSLMYRATSAGPSSGVNIQDANLLKIRVTYCYEMFVPFADRTIYSLVNGIRNFVATGSYRGMEVPTTPNFCTGRATLASEWRIPLESEAIVRMQSPYRGN